MGVRWCRRCFRRNFPSVAIGVISSRHSHEGRRVSFKVRTTGDQGSGILTSMVKANCLIDVPVEVERVNPGDEVTVQLLSGEAWPAIPSMAGTTDSPVADRSQSSLVCCLNRDNR